MTESVGSGGDSALALASTASVRSAARPLSNSEVIQSRSMEVGITCDPLRLRSCLWPARVLSAEASPTSCLKAAFAGFDGRFTFGLRLSRLAPLVVPHTGTKTPPLSPGLSRHCWGHSSIGQQLHPNGASEAKPREAA